MTSIDTLTPTQLVKDGAGLDITALLADATEVTLQFANTGREVLLVSAGADSETVTVDVGVTVLGQSVTNFDAVSLTNGDMYAFGPFDSAVDQAGTSTVQVVLSTVTDITVALLQMPGAF